MATTRDLANHQSRLLPSLPGWDLPLLALCQIQPPFPGWAPRGLVPGPWVLFTSSRDKGNCFLALTPTETGKHQAGSAELISQGDYARVMFYLWLCLIKMISPKGNIQSKQS